ncbi:hypothetical protein [Kushneria aurantia]|uniref:Uncharacterized protein n=1 Tax=Kushneria aurantia TaxID=504092 RepID=A0ABV6G3T0_9GAMM|nr:hypothetical protein [Kushneria aurantia]
MTSKLMSPDLLPFVESLAILQSEVRYLHNFQDAFDLDSHLAFRLRFYAQIVEAVSRELLAIVPSDSFSSLSLINLHGCSDSICFRLMPQ